MKIRLVFDDWKKDYKSVYNTEKGVDLSMGPFHSGTTFEAEIDLHESEEKELKKAMEEGFVPHFYVIPNKKKRTSLNIPINF